MVDIKIINKSNHDLPTYATQGSAGVDIKANLKSESVVLRPGEIALIPTGLYTELPDGYELQIRPRSGLALKKGITVLNSPGTIDSSYRGEIGIILINHSDWEFVVNDGDKIAQMVLAKHEVINWISTDKLSESERGDGGFGHTGI